MIVYSPINGEVLTDVIKYYPRTVFVMTQLGKPIPNELNRIRNILSKELQKYEFKEKDASSLLTGKDFLDKIWKIILGVPIGIAILTKDMQPKTLANILYELGMMDALGKETLIIKETGYEIPSDFKRTEYLNCDEKFSEGFSKFQENIKERELHYETMADCMDANPVLSLDYLRRAYLISSDGKYQIEAKKIFDLNISKIDSHSKLHIKSFIKSKKMV